MSIKTIEPKGTSGRLARRYSLSGRCRYYWTVPEVESSLQRFLANLKGRALPWTLLRPYLPAQSRAMREGYLALVRAAVRQVPRDYSWAVSPRDHEVALRMEECAPLSLANGGRIFAEHTPELDRR